MQFLITKHAQNNTINNVKFNENNKVINFNLYDNFPKIVH